MRAFRNPDNLPPSLLDLSTGWVSELIVSYMPPNTVMTLDGVEERAWASVSGGERLPADHLLYGGDGGPATWSTLQCGTAHVFTFDVPLDAPVGNLVPSAVLTRRM